MRRPARPRANVERSTGVAEHHARTVLTRLNLTRLVAIACIGALGLLPAMSAHAATTSDQITSTSRAIDAAAQRWFAAQAQAMRLDANIADVQHRIADAQVIMNRTRGIATARAVVMYKNADVGLSSIFGDNALDSARRAQLVDDANAGGDAAIAQLTASVDNLNAQRRNLQNQKDRLQKTLRDVAVQRQSLDRELASIRTQARHDATVALESARDRVARARAADQVRALAAVRPASNVLAAPTGPPVFNVSTPVAPPSDNGQVSPHHDDPFLACTRARESAGIYDVVSPSGYYGAYQFLPSTWDTVAVHEGRLDLVGVLPSHASELEQDETAWALYQWQGKAPWGGRC